MKLQRAKKMLKKCVYADTPEEDQAEKIKELEHILAEQEYENIYARFVH